MTARTDDRYRLDVSSVPGFYCYAVIGCHGLDNILGMWSKAGDRSFASLVACPNRHNPATCLSPPPLHRPLGLGERGEIIAIRRLVRLQIGSSRALYPIIGWMMPTSLSAPLVHHTLQDQSIIQFTAEHT